MGKFIRSKILSTAQQRFRMALLHPNFNLQRFDHSQLTWIGEVQPTDMSETYKIRVSYSLNNTPQTTVLTPQLKTITGAARPPHTFKNWNLCLYYGKYDEWHSGMFIAETIVPWISLWLFYYEGWLATGTWQGGGINH